MSSKRSWTAGSRRLAVLFFLVALPPAITLVWLGLQLLNEDRALLAQRELERRQASLDAVVRSLGKKTRRCDTMKAPSGVHDDT